MSESKIYDTAIAGGGLAGLSVAIQLARVGHSVILFEKEKYPFHKVCGEYISLEAWDHLIDLGVNLDELNVPIINQLEVSSVSGNTIKHHLPLGGFGISRYTLDAKLAEIAIKTGVILYDNTRVQDIVFNEDVFEISAGNETFRSRTALGCWGKRSNIDIKWKRKFSTSEKNKLNNYIGVKYHVKANAPVNQIVLHNFENGYCGMSKVENDVYNICYLTTAGNLKKTGSDIKKMEREILTVNPRLKELFNNFSPQTEAFTISQISFEKKTIVENHVLMIGDAAGMITPLCGNGMSMALHAGKIAFTQLNHFLKGMIPREKMEKRYEFLWRKKFSTRMKTGRMIQRFFGKKWLTNLFIASVKPFPRLVDSLIRKTHGKPF